MTVKEILINARKLISDEKNWTKGTFARDEKEAPVEPDGLRAVCFCSAGAVRHVAMKSTNKRSDALQLNYVALNALSLELKDYSHIYQFNDNSSHQEVLSLFDKTISNCQ